MDQGLNVLKSEITTSRFKMAACLVVSLAFVAMALMLPQEADRYHWKMLFSIGFFSACACVFTWVVIRPTRLLLDEEGFTLAGGFVRSARKVRWEDIDEFFVYRVARGGRMIAYNYKPGVRRVTAMTRISKAFGADGAFPRGWKKSAEEMVADLNAYRLGAIGA